MNPLCHAKLRAQRPKVAAFRTVRPATIDEAPGSLATPVQAHQNPLRATQKRRLQHAKQPRRVQAWRGQIATGVMSRATV